MKRWLILIGVILAIVVGIGLIKGLQVKKAIAGFATAGEPQSAVSTTQVDYQDWQTELNAVGSLRAVRGVDLATEVSGLVRSVDFTSGANVRAGARLLQLVSDSDSARLESLEASAELAETTYKRDQLQLEAEAISQSQLDTSSLTLKNARAQVAEQAALVAKKELRAPFAGRLGITTINPGQYLNAGDKIVTLQQFDPIYFDFSLPQQALAQLATGQKVSVTSDSFPELVFHGAITAIDPVVDADTRNVKVQATLKNPDRKLVPGMFANVTIAIGEPRRYLTLPQTAVTFNPYGQTVFVVVIRGAENAPDPNEPAALAKTEALDKIDAGLRAGNAPAAAPPASAAPPPQVARQVFVITGPTRGDQIAVLSGVRQGDEVVTSGQLKLKNGTRVSINNAILPTFDPAPKPADH